MTELEAKGLTFQVVGKRLKVKGPLTVLTPELLEVIRSHKAEIVEEVISIDILADLPFPAGYRGLPHIEVAAAVAMNHHLGVFDPIERKLNVLMWLMSGMVWDGDTGELYQRIKGEYHRLRHSDPTIADPCGICECGDGDGKSA